MSGGGLALDWGVPDLCLVHGTKVWIVEAMDWIDRPLAAAELESVFGEERSLSAISYHLNSLAEAGVLERAEERQVRGAMEAHYRFTERVKPKSLN
jgi:DNA-binding transcriptional ArsR family regulator